MICSKLLDYNFVDVEGLILLNDYFNLIEDQFQQAELVFAPPEDGIYASKMHDHDMIRDYRNEMVFDTKWQEWRRPKLKPKEQIGEKFTLTLKDLEDQAKRGGNVVKYENLYEIGKVGGYVPPPVRTGMFNWVVTIDFHKQYPNAIISSNAGIRTVIQIDHYDENYVYDKFGVKWDRKNLIETPIAFFRKDVDSVNRSKFNKWLLLRKQSQKIADNYLDKVLDQEDPFWKLLDGKQFRVKTFTNGGFGIMGLPQDRNYSEVIFDSCTLMSQDLTMKMMDVVRRLGYELIGGDTDSCFPILKSDNIFDAYLESVWLVNVINLEIDKYLEVVYNIQEHTMVVGIETISDKFLVKAAKNYVKRNVFKDGVILDKPQLEVKGIEMKKSNTSKISADMQEVLVNILLDSKNIPRDFSLLIKTLDKNFSRLPWHYIAPHGRIQNNLTDYDEGNQNARGARNALKYLNKVISPGDNPYIIPFEKFPKKINGHYISPYKGEKLILSFDEEDIPSLKKMDFVPDYKDLKRSQIHLKANPFLALISTNYDKIKAQSAFTSDMGL